MHLISNLISFIPYSCINLFMHTNDNHNHGMSSAWIPPSKYGAEVAQHMPATLAGYLFY